MASQDEFAARLGRIDCCAVSDALDKLGMKGCVTGLQQFATQKRIAGTVHTVRLVAKDKVAASSGPPRHLGTTAIEACRPGEIIVVEQRSGIEAGSWGGILSLGAKLKGVAGVIADGPVRDIDEARQMEFPVYGRMLTARTARNRVAEESTDQPITVGDVTVKAGDYALADGSAVIFIAAADIEKVLQAAEDIAAREAAMAKDLHAGKKITEVMGANYEHMLQKK
jgi:4-hydroxy-4-methyl-2-oxoglutarate aldolase